ncbi:MAG: hypothetical protein WD751_08985 [Anaerolineales bacterium]
MAVFFGFETATLENSHLHLEYLTEAGPRIVHLSLGDSRENILGEFPDVEWPVPSGRYQLLGGHRLWAAPEIPGVSYAPDSAGLQITEAEGGLDLTWEPRQQGLAKSIRVTLVADRPAVRLVHTITNRFEHGLQLAPWGITVLPLGGRAYLPSAGEGNGLHPDRHLVLWPYARWDDPRIALMTAGITVAGKAGSPPLKVGAFVDSGVCAYLRSGILMVIRFAVQEGDYPDRQCNVEAYCSDRYLELETLGTLADLAPGESASFEETWEIYAGAEAKSQLSEIFPH